MIIIKIMLVEIALVVITTVHHTSAHRTTCENLIHETELFKATGRKTGLLNFQHAFKHLSLQKIQSHIQSTPSNHANPWKIREQEKVTIAYFLDLFDDGMVFTLEKNLLFLYPEQWCSNKVIEYRLTNFLGSNILQPLQVGECLGYIVGYLCTQEDCQSGKMEILKSLYKNWSYEKIQAILSQYPNSSDSNQEWQRTLTEKYLLGYFKHVAVYINNSMHASYASNYKGIKYFCDYKGNNMVTY